MPGETVVTTLSQKTTLAPEQKFVQETGMELVPTFWTENIKLVRNSIPQISKVSGLPNVDLLEAGLTLSNEVEALHDHCDC